MALQNQKDGRLNEALIWVNSVLDKPIKNLETVSGDASFRRYFRVRTGSESLILMDAPPDKEDSRPFVEIASRLQSAGLRAPTVHRFDFEKGFGLLEDFGDILYRQKLTPDNGNLVIPDLLMVLSQLATKVETKGLPTYSPYILQTELDLFIDWYLEKHRQIILEESDRQLWNTLCEKLKQSASEQPQVFVHRDFHSCNLLFEANKSPAVIDFQDALHGPISYDFISLVWDRYIAWPRAQLEFWMSEFHHILSLDVDMDTWVRWCDLMSLQRNLKIVGIFARLHYRDQKEGYLEMIPQFYQYILDVLAMYPEFESFQQLMERPECAP